MPTDLTLFKCSKGSNLWYTINDEDTLGGKTKTYLKFEEPDHVMFHGEIDTRELGFCVLRSNDFSPALDLSGFAGIALELRSPQD